MSNLLNQPSDHLVHNRSKCQTSFLIDWQNFNRFDLNHTCSDYEIVLSNLVSPIQTCYFLLRDVASSTVIRILECVNSRCD